MKPTSIELFAGCGGLALGLEQAGFETVLLVENDATCVKTLRANRQWNVLEKDITTVDFKPYKNITLVSGGFPCQSWSNAGKRKGLEDDRGQLFYQFKRAIEEIKPLYFIGENVQGLATHNGGETLKEMLKFQDYNISAQVLDAVDFGVAQKRKRLIIYGSLKHLKHPTYPMPTQRLTIRDVLQNVPESAGAKYSEEKIELFKQIPEGGCWVDLPVETQKAYMKKSFESGGGKRGILRKIAWNEPCLTLLTSPSQKQTERCHPENRPFTTREYARIQSFPDEYVFCGSTTKIYKQIGNAVPPTFAYHIGKAVIDVL